MRKLLFATTALLALSGAAQADVVLTLNGPVDTNTIGPQSTSNPCIICATAASQPAGFGFNNFTESGSIAAYNMFSTAVDGGNNGTNVADGVQGTSYLASQLTNVVGNAFNIAIDVNTAGGAQGGLETLQLFQVIDTTTNTILAHFSGPALIGNIANNGNGFGDFSLNTVDLTGVPSTDGILFHAVWDGASDGGESFFLVSSTPMTAVPEVSTWFMMLLGFAGVGLVGMRKKLTTEGFRFV